VSICKDALDAATLLVGLAGCETRLDIAAMSLD
jgi:hypothetical protein